MAKKVIYISHPYGGNIANATRVISIQKELAKKYPDYVFISAITAIQRPYESGTYGEGLILCLELESRCDAIYLCGDWLHSVGCRVEERFASEMGITIFTEEEELLDADSIIDHLSDPVWNWSKDTIFEDINDYIERERQDIKDLVKEEGRPERRVSKA